MRVEVRYDVPRHALAVPDDAQTLGVVVAEEGGGCDVRILP